MRPKLSFACSSFQEYSTAIPFPSSVYEWNQLSEETVHASSADVFTSAVSISHKFEIPCAPSPPNRDGNHRWMVPATYLIQIQIKIQNLKESREGFFGAEGEDHSIYRAEDGKGRRTNSGKSDTSLFPG